MTSDLKQRKRWEQTAFHESARAVIARKLGLACPGIMMFPTDPQSRAGALRRG
jgi:hypothetical protein